MNPWSRFDGFTEKEKQDIHHALRMLLKHPLTPSGEEADRIKAMADEIWNEHAARVAGSFASRKDSAGGAVA